MRKSFAESHIEEAALGWLAELGYSIRNGLDIAPDSKTPERTSYGDAPLFGRLRQALDRLNPAIPPEARADAMRRIERIEYPSLVEENRRLHTYLVEGLPVEFYGVDGVLRGDYVRLIAFDDPEANDWLAVNQYTVIENKANRRPDVVIFVNGLPLSVLELKNPGDETATMQSAFNQLQTYKSQITSLFRTNAVLVISDGLAARAGSLTADYERFMPWRTVTGDDLAPKGAPELETVLKGVFDKRRFLALLKDFIVFGDKGDGVVKILAGYHQFHAVKRAVASTLRAIQPPSTDRPLAPEHFDLPSPQAQSAGDRKVGVIWHTQGSGKSLLMAFYAGQIVKHPALENPTLIVLTDRDEEAAVRVFLEKYEIVKAIFRPETKGGFDYRPALDAQATPQSRLVVMAGAMDWVLTQQQADAAKEKTEEGKKRAHRRYADGVVALSKAFALASASDEARRLREEVGFFQAIRAALIKTAPGDGKKSAAERELAIQQIVSRAIISTEIVDIMKAAGLQSPDISVLSEEFLAEVRQSDKKNLAIEALKKLINGEVRAQSHRNVTQSKAFTERLEAAIARYHINAITTAEVLEELIRLAKDIKAARARGEESGLSDDEVAFYDALAENESAREAMKEEQLRVIAQELVTGIKGSISVDWVHRENARARIRVLVKRILRKYGYPPDLQDAAVQNVLQQAEALSAAWAV